MSQVEETRAEAEARIAAEIDADSDAEARRWIEKHVAHLGSPEETRAIAAERRLIRYGNRAVDALIAATGDSNPETRFRAVYALGKIGDSRAFDTLIQCAEDPDPRVAYDAILALGELTSPETITPLLALIEEVQREESSLSVASTSSHAIHAALLQLPKPDTA